MGRRKLSAEQMLAESFDTSVHAPAAARSLALDIAEAYVTADRVYGKTSVEVWKKAWKSLNEEGGIPKTMCAAKLRSMIEAALSKMRADGNEAVPVKFTSGFYKVVARREGYSAPRISTGDKDMGSAARYAETDKSVVNAEPVKPEINPVWEHGETPIGNPPMPDAGSSASRTLPKARPRPEASSPAPQEHAHNQSLVAVLRHTRRTFRMIERTLEETPDLPVYISAKQRTDLENTLLFVADSCADAMNRKSVLPPSIHPLFHQLYRSEASLLNIGAELLRWRADRMSEIGAFITKKQAAKFLRGREPSQLPLYEPKSREEAVFMHWYGLSCPNCDGWRVSEAQHVFLTDEEARRIGDDSRPLLQCHDCDNMWRGYTVMACTGPHSCGMLFYREDLVKIKKTGACPSCKKEIRLPDHLVQYLAHPETWWQKKRRHPRPKAPVKEVLP